MRFALLLFVSILSFFSATAQSEKMTFHNLTTSMGLSHGDITSIFQDHEGYIWIGTSDGLNKYDGIGFTVYKNIENDTTSLTSSYINCIYEDKQNNLWIGLSEGLNRYNRDKDNFERIAFIDSHDTKSENSVNQVFEDESNNLWIGCGVGVYILNRETTRFTSYFEDSSGINNLTDCTGICQDKNGILWFSFMHSSDFGLIKYDPATNTNIRYSEQNPKYKLKENTISSLMVDNQNNLWIGYYSNGIDVLNAQTNTITSYENINNSRVGSNILSMVQNENGNIYIGTNGEGMNVFNSDTKTFSQYTSTKSVFSLLSNVVQKIYISREDVVWIGCWGGGVTIYDKRFDRFKHYKKDENDNNSLDVSSVTCFAEDLNGNIWVATDGGGINYFNPSTGKFIKHLSDSENPKTLSNNKILALATDNKGGLWAGMWQGGLNYFKIEGEQLILKKKYDYVVENNKNSNSVFKIYINKNDELWVGCFAGGAYKFDPKLELFESINLSTEPVDYNSVRDIFCDSYNNMWFATDNYGLVMMNSETGESDRFIHDENDSASLIKGSINVVFEDSKKRLWMGGDYDGLNLFNRQTKSFTHYTTEQGLPDNSIQGILEDEQGNLWISSRAGISKATIDSTNSLNGKLKLSFRNYTVQDGLQSNVFNRWAYFKSRNGEMYFGGLNGFNVFNPDNIKDNNYIPPVYLTDFLLFNKPVTIGAKDSPLKKHISQTKKLVLNYDQSSFTFRFIALNYIFSEKNQYAYMMEGFEKNWNFIGNKNEATYMNLNPGNYTFRVKASNNDGKWNEEGTSIKIIILPPWWGTLWFRLIIGLIIFLLMGYFLYIIILKIRRQANLTILDERNQLKTMINNIPDHIFIKDTKSRFLILNNNTIKYMKGKSEKEFLYKTDFDFHPKEKAEKYFRQEQEIISNGIPIINEESRRNINGQEMVMSTTKCPIINLKGETIGLIGIVRDITYQKIAELEIIKQSEELRNYNFLLNEKNLLLEERQQQIEKQAEKLTLANGQLSLLNATKDRFFSIIAHDLRNPFNNILGFTEILNDNDTNINDEEKKEITKQLFLSASNTYELLENLLEWSRTQSNRITFKSQQVDLENICQEVIDSLISNSKNIKIKYLPTEKIELVVDSNMFKTILRNIISNAIKFSHKNGLINIDALKNSEKVTITISDNGIGIEKENLSKLFDLTQKLSTIGTAQEKGTGLGLIICKEFVEKHGGEIWVESEVGNGSDFKFTIPL